MMFGKAKSRTRWGGQRLTRLRRAPLERRVEQKFRRIEEKRSVRLGPFFVQGKKASDIEYTCYITLLRLGWTDDEISFQIEAFGGRVPGGQVTDFVVVGYAVEHVIAVNGDTWHSRTEARRQKDLTAQAVFTERLGRETHYVVASTGDLFNDEVAYHFLLREIGMGPGTLS